MVKRYQRGSQKPYIKGKTTQWSKDTKGEVRSRKSKERQHNGQKKKDKQRSTEHYTEN
jgi:hypothetical protein